MGMSLNIGCGGNVIYAFKDFNCDIHCDLRKPIRLYIPNFILCDASHLPFRSNAFTYVVASHLVEHLPFPQKAISEMRRICDGEVRLIYPHFLSPFAYIDPSHKWVTVYNRFYPIPKFMHLHFIHLFMWKVRAITQKLTRFRMPWLEEERILCTKD